MSLCQEREHYYVLISIRHGVLVFFPTTRRKRLFLRETKIRARKRYQKMALNIKHSKKNRARKSESFTKRTLFYFGYRVVVLGVTVQIILD